MIWNVRSISSPVKLQKFLNFIIDYQVDICCVTETWFESLKGVHTKTIEDSGYFIAHAVREGKKGGGTAILIKHNLKIKNYNGSCTDYSSFEYTFLCIPYRRQKLMFICIYRLGEVSCSNFCEEINDLLQNLSEKCDMFVAVGDFNVWAEDPKNADFKKLKQTMSSFGLSQIVNQPTHLEGHTLDLIFLNKYQLNPDHNVITEILDCTSDHYPICFKIPYPTFPALTKRVNIRNTKGINMDILKNDLLNNLRTVNFNATFEEIFLSFTYEAKSVIDRHAPIISKVMHFNNKPAWMDSEFKNSRSRRRKLEKEWKRKNTWESRLAYIDQRKLCVKLAISKKKCYYEQLISRTKNDQGALFKIVKNLLDTWPQRTLPSHENGSQLANKFNKFFIEKVKRIRSSIPIVYHNPYTYIPFDGDQLLEFAEISEEDILAIIRQHGIKTSPLDPIPLPLLKESFHDLLPYYTLLINRSLHEGSAAGFKFSVVDPLLKNAKLDTEPYASYRPVANLVFFSKLIERLVQIQLNDHMNRNALYDDTQFGYKKFNSTETMLLGLIDEVLRGFDQNKCPIVIFLDLSAAFDTVDVNKLLEILKIEIGIDGTALKWIESFLKGRFQCVKIDSSFSEFLNTTFGFPQGSLLGPFFFTIYVRSQPNVFKNCHFKSSSFADDTSGRRTFSLMFQFDNLSYKIENCLQEIKKWMNIHFLKINTDKTEILLFCPKELSEEVIIKGVILDNEECIRFSDEVKNVGIWLDMHLNFNMQINKTVSHCHKLIKDIWKIRSILSKENTEKLVHSMISLRLDFCNSLYYGISQKNLNKLQKVQNSAARLVCKVGRRENIHDLIFNLHWLPVSSRILYKILLMTHKCAWAKCSTNLINLLTFKSYAPSDDVLFFQTNFAANKYGKRAFSYIAPRLWNSLPFNIRTEEDTVSFKKLLKTYLFSESEDFARKVFCYD